jgi:hypothetical protein
VAQACNPSYSGGRDQEAGSQSGQIVCKTASQKNPSQKRVAGVALNPSTTGYIYPGYKSFIRYMFCKFFLPICGLPFHFLDSVFDIS